VTGLVLIIKNKHAPAGRFNLGEKLVYRLSVAVCE
jgi:hypothetical protein